MLSVRRRRRRTKPLLESGTIVIRIELTDADARRLEQAFLQASDRKLRDRTQIVRLAHRGRPHRDIAADLGITPRTVQRWLNAYLQGGFAALVPRKAKGQPPAIPIHLARDIRRWVIDGPASRGLDRANWTHAELADHLRKAHGITASRSAMQRFCRKNGIRLYRPTYRLLRGDPVKQAEARVELAELRTKAEAGELVLLSQDEARFPMVPTLGAALGVKGHRPTVGTRDCKDLLSVFAVVNVVTAALHCNILESPARARRVTGKSKTRRMQEAFAAHLRHVGRAYPKGKHERVVLIIDNAPWHRGQLIDEALADHPNLEFKRLPSYSPQLNVIEHFWKLLRRRATHNRFFESLSDLRRSIRASLCYFQTVKRRVRSMVAKSYPRPENQKASAGL
jgi:transposase